MIVYALTPILSAETLAAVREGRPAWLVIEPTVVREWAYDDGRSVWHEGEPSEAESTCQACGGQGTYCGCEACDDTGSAAFLHRERPIDPNAHAVAPCRHCWFPKWQCDIYRSEQRKCCPDCEHIPPTSPSLPTGPCPDCDDGVATWQEGDATCVGSCWSCDGTGRVVRVYAAETECREGTADSTDGSPWKPWGPSCDWPDDLDESESWHERRQVVRWQATTATLYPVIGDDFSAERIARTIENRLCPADAIPRIAQRWGEWLMWTDPAPHSIGERIGDEPWAAGLRPGQQVLRLDGWEPVNPAITEMACPQCNGRLGDPDRLDEAFWLNGRVEPGSVPECPVCSGQPGTNGYPTGVVPLSVPSGSIVRIEVP